MTERLYYQDSYLKEFTASIVETAEDGHRVYLDRTAFYPTSGGQPHDTGTIGGIPVIEVIDEDDRIAHILASPAGPGEAPCRIDWTRRFDHMQQHTGQHLLSAVLTTMYGAGTVGFHLGTDACAIDVASDGLSDAQIEAAEARANEIVTEDRKLAVTFEEAAEASGLRKPSDREGTLRIVSIADLDRSACGGTHVRTTGEIGPVLIRHLDRAHGKVRIEFVCGMRAVRRARADFNALSRIARTFSAPLDETPERAASQTELFQSCEKARRKAATELARIGGRELYQTTEADTAGLRYVCETVPGESLDDEMRARAQGFTESGKACFVAASEGGRPAILVAVSKESGLHAGNLLKEALAAAGGRGGGSAQLAQGSVPEPAALAGALAAIAAKRQ